MKSQEKKIKLNKNKLNELGNFLFEDSNSQQKSLNSKQKNDKKEKVSFPNIYYNLNILTPNPKLNNNKSKLLNLSMKKINKLYVSTKSKNYDLNNSNELNNMSALSKITKREFSDRNKANKILEALNDTLGLNNLDFSKLNSSREENPLFKNLARKNINYLKNINKNNISENLNELDKSLSYYLYDQMATTVVTKSIITQKENQNDIIMQYLLDKKFRNYIFDERSQILIIKILKNFFRDSTLVIIAIGLDKDYSNVEIEKV